MTRITRGLLLCLALLAGRGALAQPDGMLAGNLSSVGSDTLANLMALWAQDFSQHYPNVNLQIQAAGSSTAPTALAAGAAQLGPMSRPMKAAEVSAFEHRYGYAPLAVPVAVDALVVLVHQDNPLRGLNLQQLDRIFSATRRCGESQPLTRWGELGLSGDWATRSLQRFGRNSASGTYGYFKLRALCGGDFMPRVNELPGSASVVQGWPVRSTVSATPASVFAPAACGCCRCRSRERTMLRLPPPTCATIATRCRAICISTSTRPPINRWSR